VYIKYVTTFGKVLAGLLMFIVLSLRSLFAFFMAFVLQGAGKNLGKFVGKRNFACENVIKKFFREKFNSEASNLHTENIFGKR
jgi:hypothetical protein